MIIIKVKSLDRNSLIIYKNFLESTLSKLVVAYRISNIPAAIKRITLLKSPHVNKKSREQFQHTRYKVLFKVESSLSMKILKYIISNKPNAVKVIVTQIQALQK